MGLSCTQYVPFLQLKSFTCRSDILKNAYRWRRPRICQLFLFAFFLTLSSVILSCRCGTKTKSTRPKFLGPPFSFLISAASGPIKATFHNSIDSVAANRAVHIGKYIWYFLFDDVQRWYSATKLKNQKFAYVKLICQS